MKTCIQTLGIMMLAASLSYGEDAPKKKGEKGKRPDPEAMFKKLDADSNGSVSLAEFKASPRAQKNATKAEEIFKKMDTDSNGGVNLEEFKSHKPGHAPKGAGKPGKGKKKGGAAPAQ